MPVRPRVLMCEPTFFGVEYVINPWMEGNVGVGNPERARSQWHALKGLIEEFADVELIQPGPALPDMCFTANGGMVFDSRFVPARFRVDERAAESDLHRAWFSGNDFKIVELDHGFAFEGEGDALWWSGPESPPLVWAGYGMRSDLESHAALARAIEIEVVSLRLVDPRFYHLDTCFLPLPQGRVMFFREAFDAASQAEIDSRTSPEQRIEINEEDALQFACNAVRIGTRLIVNYASASLQSELSTWGLSVETTPLDEFVNAGGAAKCLTLLLQQDA